MSNYKQQIMKNDNNVIKKIKKEKAFAQISNELINNRELSYKALGILTYILSKPDDWQVYMSDLIRENVDGEKSVRNGLNELIEKRYVQRYRVYNKDTGKVHHWETLVSEIPFSEEEIISSIKETYALNKDGEIAYQKITLGTFERYVPLVIDREVTLLCQKGKVEKKEDEITTFPKGTSRKPTSRKRRTTNTNSTNTDSTNMESSSSKEKNLQSIHPLIELFNNSICELKKTTTAKFMQYVEKYDEDFIKAVIEYCETMNANSYAYFEKTIEQYIDNDITTKTGVKDSIKKFRQDNKNKKKRALEYKDKVKKEEEFNKAMVDRMMDDLAKGSEDDLDEPVEIKGEDVNDKIKTFAKQMIEEIAYKTWIDKLDIRLDGNIVIVGCLNNFTKEIIEKRYLGYLLKSVELAGIKAKLKAVVVA